MRRGRGVIVDEKLRTAADWVYAVGDCAGRYLFTHSGAAEAVVALRNVLFPGSAKAPDVVPWTTFTDPELGHVGMTFEEARKRLGADKVRSYAWDLSHSDRARTESATDGRIIVVTDAKFRILGAHMLSPTAGEMNAQFTLAIREGLKLTPDFGDLVQVYPTYSTAISQVAGEATYGQLERPFLRTHRRIKSALSR